MISDFIAGINYFLKGLGQITRPGLKRFVLVPAIISFATLSIILVLAFYQFSDLLEWVMPNRSTLSDWPEWLAWFADIALSILRVFLYTLFAILSLIITSFSYTILANLVASPFNGRLSEKTEEVYYSEKPIIDTETSLFKEIPSAVLHEVRKILYFFKFLIPLIFISFIPVINIISAPLWFIFGAWVLSVEYCDFPAGNNNHSFKELKAKLAEKRALSLGFGAAASVLTMIPILNFLVMPAAVIGATLLWKENHQQIKQISNENIDAPAITNNFSDTTSSTAKETNEIDDVVIRTRDFD